MRALVPSLTAVLLVACSPPPPPPAVDAPAEPELFCPGSAGCEGGDGPVLVGAAERSITPEGFEIPRAAYLSLDRPDACDPGLPKDAPGTCGTTKENIYDDCGHDGVCAGDLGYTAPDTDGSQGDGAPDWWRDCGRDRICPPPEDTPEEGALADNGVDDDGDGAVDEGPYTGPDEDGSEGDGIAQVLWIAGNEESKPVMGVADTIWAKAVVVEQGDTTVAIVGMDVIGLFADEEERIQAKVSEQRPGALDLIVLSASHTHCAPDVMGQWGLVDPFAGLQFGPGRDDVHMELLRTRTAEAIVAAYDAREEALVSVGQTRTGIVGVLRDGRDPQIVNDYLTAIVVRKVDDDAVIATLLNWGSHPETLGNRNNFVSPDFVASLRTSVQAGLPATADAPAHEGQGGVVVYTTSTVGGQVGSNGFPIVGRDGTTYEDGKKTYARTQALGERLAEHAFMAIDAAVPLDAPALRFSTQSYEEPVENSAFHVGFFNGWFDRALLRFDPNEPISEDNLPWLRTRSSLLYLGDLGLLTIPGEAFTESWLGFDDQGSHADPLIKPDNQNPPDLTKAPQGAPWKERLGAKHPVALGLAHDMTGYLVPPYDFQLDPTAPYISDDIPGDHYDETNGCGPQAVPLFEANLKTLLDFEASRGGAAAQ